MSNTDNKGKDVEDLVEKICTKMFFSDFTVRSKKFKNASKQEKEVADILIPFGDVLLAVQVKTRKDKKPSSEKRKIDLARIDNRIEEAVDQFKTLKRALANFRFNEVETTRGYKIPFDGRFKKIMGIVVFDLVGEDISQPDEDITIINGFEARYDIPIHIFKRNEFEIISTEIDTLPDFIQYIETREILFSKKLFAIPPLELSLLALYKTKSEDLQFAIESNSQFIVDDGYWEWYEKDCKELIQNRNSYNRPSYLIDDVINWLHSSVGFDPSKYGINLDPFGFFGEESQGTIQAYLAVTTELAKTSRLTRRKLGEKFFECVERASKNGLAYSLIIDQENNSGIVILASEKDRTERSKILYSVSVAGYCLQNLTKIIGFATEPLGISMRSYDVIFLSGVDFENKAEAIENAEKLFGTYSEAKFYEFLNLPDKEIK